MHSTRIVLPFVRYVLWATQIKYTTVLFVIHTTSITSRRKPKKILKIEKYQNASQKLSHEDRPLDVWSVKYRFIGECNKVAFGKVGTPGCVPFETPVTSRRPTTLAVLIFFS